MAQISRLRDAEISNGNLIDADDIDAELNQLVNESNSQDNRLTVVESSNLTIAGVKTFTSAPRMDQISERTVDAGVTVDGVQMKDGAVKPAVAADPAVLASGMMWYNSTDHILKAQVNGLTRTVALKEDLPLPRDYIGGPPPVMAGVSGITLPEGLMARSSDHGADILLSSDLTLSLATSGAGGLDAGSEAANTWYYVYLIKNSSNGTVSAVFSTVNEAASGAITMPAGYDLKKQLPVAYRNDASSNLIPCIIAQGWPYRPLIAYTTDVSHWNGSSYGNATITNVLSAGSATSYTGVSLASYVPPISQLAELAGMVATGTGEFALRATGSSRTAEAVVHGWTQPGGGVVRVPTNASQSIDYKRLTGASGTLYLDVTGFVVTEV